MKKNKVIEKDKNIARLLSWGESQSSVRAMLLTSTRAKPNPHLDLFSDYDVILAVSDVRPFYEDRSWLEDFGLVLVVYRDPIQRQHNQERFAYITQYEDGLKIDFTLMTAEILKHIAGEPKLPDELDVGYVVLMDKDGLTNDLKTPTFQAYIPTQPDEDTFLTVIEVFFHETTYVAKLLWRDELMPAKYSLDHGMKQGSLRKMLEWYIQGDSIWAIKPGALGKGLKKRLEPDLWAKLEKTYTGSDLEDNWEALFASIDLFREVAVEVARRLSFDYPEALEQRVVDYLLRVRQLDRHSERFSSSSTAGFDSDQDS
jgi:aminoglycoside 6-adenylyltransferase